jgi:hypothetical protein
VRRHNDLPYQLYKNEHNVLASVDLRSDLRLVWNISHTDIPRLRAGKLGAQVGLVKPNIDSIFLHHAGTDYFNARIFLSY